MSDRFASQGDRVVDILKGFGPSSAGKTLDELQAAARKSNAPAYEFFRRQSERGAWTPELEQLTQAPAVQDAIRSVVKTGANKTVVDGMPPIRNPFSTDAAGNLQLARQADGSIAYPNGQFWDYVQRELRGKAGEAARSGNNDLARDYGNLRTALVNHMDELFPACIAGSQRWRAVDHDEAARDTDRTAGARPKHSGRPVYHVVGFRRPRGPA